MNSKSENYFFCIKCFVIEVYIKIMIKIDKIYLLIIHLKIILTKQKK